MERRNFIAGIAGAASVAAIAPVAVMANSGSTNWLTKADEMNTFSSDDTVYERLEKFNKLTGAGLSFGYIDVRGEYAKNEKFYGAESCGRTVLVYPDGRGTGYMDKEAFMHWTAQVGLGYRMAQAQGV